MLQSMRSQRVKYNSATENSTNHFTNLLLSLLPQPLTTTFLLSASMSSNFFFHLEITHRQRNLAGYSALRHKESATTEAALHN